MSRAENNASPPGLILAPRPQVGIIAALALLLVLLVSTEALAHRLNVFAWLEGDSIVVECGFNRSSPLRSGLVVVFDATSGKELLQGRTDEQGRFLFAVPEAVRQGHGLRMEVNGGEGHVNDWTMTAKEISEALDLSHGFQAGANSEPALSPSASSSQPKTSAAQGQPLTATEVRAIVAESLNAGLAPLRRELAALSSGAPTLRDIIGGLGWIMGLVGIGCFFLARRERQKP